MHLPLWSRLRLAPRIAIMITLTLATSTGLDWTLRGMVPDPDVLLVQRDWLIDAVGAARNAAAAVPTERRAEILRDLPAWPLLSFSMTATPVRMAEPLPPLLGALRRDMATRLNLPLDDVMLTASPGTIRRGVTPVVVLLDEMSPAMLMRSDNRGKRALSDLGVSVRLTSDTWMVVVPTGDGQEMGRTIRNVLYPMGGLLLIGVLSLWVARGITRPLSDLANAAERMGHERKPTLLGEFSVPELNSIARTFNDMQLRLKRFVDDRLRMLAAISHDLRTPLTRLRLFAEYLEDSELRQQVLSDVHDMDEMISSTLTFASNQLQIEKIAPVDLASLLISVCDTAADTGFHIIYAGPDHAYLSCQPMAIRRAIVNLVDNSCKYAHSARVTLREVSAGVEFAVADDGPGIPADQIEQAFQPFVRLEGSRNRETGGAGLGLSIARDVIQSHGGSVTLAAAQPCGLIVTVRLPRQAT